MSRAPMIRRISLLTFWGCSAALILVPITALYFLWNIDLFSTVARDKFGAKVLWHTVADWQWYTLWLLTALYLLIGLVGLFFLRRAFANFAAGELFNPSNSRDLRRFAIFLFVQALLQPLHFALSSVLLSAGHPAGEKILSFSFGSNEFRSIGVALILWVMSDLLVEGSKLQTENQQFV